MRIRPTDRLWAVIRRTGRALIQPREILKSDVPAANIAAVALLDAEGRFQARIEL